MTSNHYKKIILEFVMFGARFCRYVAVMETHTPATFRAEAAPDGAGLRLVFGDAHADDGFFIPLETATAVLLGLAAAMTQALKNAGREDVPVISPRAIGVAQRADGAKLILDVQAPGGGRLLFDLNAAAARTLAEEIRRTAEQLRPAEEPKVELRKVARAQKPAKLDG